MAIANLYESLKEFEKWHIKNVRTEMQAILNELELGKDVESKYHGVGIIKIVQHNNIRTILEYKFSPYKKNGEVSINSKPCGLYITQTMSNEEIKEELKRVFKPVNKKDN